MDCSENSFSTSSKYEHSAKSCGDSSTPLNKKLQHTELDFSEIMQDDTKAAATNNTSSRRLSITVDTREKHLLLPAHNKESKNHTNGMEFSHPRTLLYEASDVIENTEDIVDVSMGDAEGQTMALEEQQTEAVESDIADDDEVPVSDRVCFQEYLVELGRRLWPSNAVEQQYTKGCLWSPDGTCALLAVHLDGMHVVELPGDLYQIDAVPLDRKVSELPSAVHVKEGGTVYDYAWYPFMSSSAPETCCWLATRKHEPIHMWDAFDGGLRCSYRGYDDVDEVESAISVTFSNDGEKVFGGYKKSIKIFDTKVPGRDRTAIRMKQAVSCFALNSSNDDTVTVGSWNGLITHHDLRAPEIGALFVLHAHKSGITWLRFASSESDSWSLFSGARKENKILQWDIRNYTEPVREFKRNVDTNQRIYFDLSPQCDWLVSGDTKGLLRIWDLCNDREDIELPLHKDCCNGVSFHPTIPILATTAGQYHFIEESLDGTQTTEDIKIDYENSLLFLWFGKVDQEEDEK